MGQILKFVLPKQKFMPQKGSNCKLLTQPFSLNAPLPPQKPHCTLIYKTHCTSLKSQFLNFDYDCGVVVVVGGGGWGGEKTSFPNKVKKSSMFTGVYGLLIEENYSKACSNCTELQIA